jgi:DNA recombination protein RmuC
MDFSLLALLLAAFNTGLMVLLLVLVLRTGRKQGKEFTAYFASWEKIHERTEKTVKEELTANREETNKNARQLREEINGSLKLLGDAFFDRVVQAADTQKEQLKVFSEQLSELTRTNENKLDKMRATVEERLLLLQNDNNKQIEQIRATVDEKLHTTLERRLGDSFKIVSERLELVHQGLGEMQSLAAGVGDLKKVLTNVKTRGIWGEIHLANLLEQILTCEQYASNVVTKRGSAERVEFAVKMPGRSGEDRVVWLPIDAKFPQEDYQRLVDAQEKADPVLAEQAAKQLVTRIKTEAKNIREKYLDPPHTTDFGIMFLPTESLFAEVLRRPGLCDTLLREHRVVVAGPTTLSALLNSLQVGFRTLAIEKRSGEVWELLGTVKTEFIKFGDILEKTRKKLQEASNTIETAARKSRTIERKLRGVQQIPSLEPEKELNKHEK